MEKVLDLDINNYDINDILNLFNISNRITEEDLKKAKLKMLKTHPDKSGLDPKFFRFYSEAYKIIYLIWEFKEKGNTKNTEYMTMEYDSDKNEILNKWFNDNKSLSENKSSFNEWFNSQFNNLHIYNERDKKGYDDWLRNKEDDNIIEAKDLNTMNYLIDERKKKLRELSLINKKDVEDIWNTNKISASDLSMDAPSNYDSGMFSLLSYQDLQKAHTETIIPITLEDYENKQKFNNVNEFISFRNSQDMNPILEGEKILIEKQKKEENMSVRLAFNLAKQTEQSKKNNELFWKNIQLLN